jgi:hypothetical protein
MAFVEQSTTCVVDLPGDPSFVARVNLEEMMREWRSWIDRSFPAIILLVVKRQCFKPKKNRYSSGGGLSVYTIKNFCSRDLDVIPTTVLLRLLLKSSVVPLDPGTLRVAFRLCISVEIRDARLSLSDSGSKVYGTPPIVKRGQRAKNPKW